MGSNRQLILFDFDHTLFRTGTVFWADLCEAISRVGNADIEAILADYDTFSTGAGRLRRTEYLRLLAHYQVDENAVAAAVRAIAMDRDYLHADARDLLANIDRIRRDRDIEILTFGDPALQRLKLSLVPEVATIPAHVVGELKAGFIARTWPDRTGMLVDDRPDQNLPIGWRECLIDRNDIYEPSIPADPADPMVIRDLRELLQLLTTPPAPSR